MASDCGLYSSFLLQPSTALSKGDTVAIHFEDRVPLQKILQPPNHSRGPPHGLAQLRERHACAVRPFEHPDEVVTVACLCMVGRLFSLNCYSCSTLAIIYVKSILQWHLHSVECFTGH